MPSARVLRTRLSPPRLPAGSIARPELSRRVAEAASTNGALIVAGAGYGKTTLLVQVLKRLSIPWAWCSCDERIAGPEALVAHVAAAIAEVAPGFGVELALSGSADDLVAGLANEVLDTIADDLVLVLDDAHALGASASAALGLLIRDLPANVHPLIASRRAVDLRRPRRRLEPPIGVGAADLALTREETSEVLRASGAVVEDSLVGRVHELTEGWAAAVALAARSDEGSGAPDPAGGGLFDYLAAEVLAREPEEIQRFLLDVAVLDRFTPALARAVSGRDDATEFLASASRDRLFLTRLDDPGEWYRFHHLFLAFLRREGASRGRRRLDELDRRAAAAWLDAGDGLEAARHALAAGDQAWAADALEPIAEEIAASAQARSLEELLDRLPAPEMEARPGLLAARATVLLARGEHEAGFRAQEATIDALLVRGDHERAAVALFRLLQSMFTSGTRPAHRVEVGRRYLDLLDPETPGLAAPRALHAAACAYARSWDEAVAQLDAAAAADAPAAVRIYVEIVRVHYVAFARDGSLIAPVELEGLIRALESGADADSLAFLAWARFLRSYELNDLGLYEQALAEAALAEREAERRGLQRVGDRVLGWVRATALAGLGRFDEAEAALVSPATGASRGDTSAYSHRARAIAALATAEGGDAPTALQHVGLARAAMRSFGPTSDDPMVLCDLAYVAWRAGDSRQAGALAAEAREAADAIGAPWDRARAAMIGAAIAGAGPEGDALLAQALSLSDDPPMDGLWMRRERRLAGLLLARALTGRLGSDGQVRRLISRCGGDALRVCAAAVEGAEASARRELAAAAGDTDGADMRVIEELLRDPDAGVRAEARAAWARLRGRPRAALRIQSLGGLAVWRDEIPVPDSAFGRQRARALFGLLLARGGPVHREELSELFWPDLAPNRAAAALRTTLHEMRRALQPELDGGSASGVVVADGETIRLAFSEHDSWDGAQLERAASDVAPVEGGVDELEAAERLYRGPFLPEWPYEDWCVEPRRRFEEAHRRVQEKLARALMAAGRHDGAALRWRRLVASEPEREAWHRELMRCYAATGERALALRQFHACRTALRRGQGVEPGAETRDLYLALLREEGRSVPS